MGVWVTGTLVLLGWAPAIAWFASTIGRWWLRVVVALPLAVIWMAAVFVAATDYH